MKRELLHEVTAGVQAGPHRAIAVSCGATHVALGDPHDPQVRVVELATGATVTTRCPASYGGRSAAFDRQATRLAIGSGFHHERGNHLLLWELGTPGAQLKVVPTQHVREVQWVGWREDGELVAARGRGGRIEVIRVVDQASVYQSKSDHGDASDCRWVGSELLHRVGAGARCFGPAGARDATAADLESPWEWIAGASHERAVIRQRGKSLFVVQRSDESALELPCAVAHVCISGDGQTIAVSTPAQELRVFTLDAHHSQPK